jgi:hypothetical protein
MVFDNADDYSLGSGSDHRRLQENYFPKTGGGVILMTTRNTDQQLTIKLEEMKMDNEATLKLLLRRELLLRRDVDLTNADYAALEIVQELGHLPLAIDMAGAYRNISNRISRELQTRSRYLSGSLLRAETDW